jgi:hypothetical protein
VYWIRRLHVSPEHWNMYKTTQCHIADDSALCGHKPGENFVPYRLIKCSLVHEILWNSCWWHPSPYLWITRCMAIQILFFLCKHFRHLTFVLFSTRYTVIFLLHYVTLWYDTFLLYFCLCFCVYIEIVALFWNSYAKNTAAENVVKYTSRMWNIK